MRWLPLVSVVAIIEALFFSQLSLFGGHIPLTLGLLAGLSFLVPITYLVGLIIWAGWLLDSFSALDSPRLLISYIAASLIVSLVITWLSNAKRYIVLRNAVVFVVVYVVVRLILLVGLFDEIYNWQLQVLVLIVELSMGVGITLLLARLLADKNNSTRSKVGSI